MSYVSTAGDESARCWPTTRPGRRHRRHHPARPETGTEPPFPANAAALTRGAARRCPVPTTCRSSSTTSPRWRAIGTSASRRQRFCRATCTGWRSSTGACCASKTYALEVSLPGDDAYGEMLETLSSLRRHGGRARRRGAVSGRPSSVRPLVRRFDIKVNHCSRCRRRPQRTRGHGR